MQFNVNSYQGFGFAYLMLNLLGNTANACLENVYKQMQNSSHPK